MSETCFSASGEVGLKCIEEVSSQNTAPTGPQELTCSPVLTACTPQGQRRKWGGPGERLAAPPELCVWGEGEAVLLKARQIMLPGGNGMEDFTNKNGMYVYS